MLGRRQQASPAPIQRLSRSVIPLIALLILAGGPSGFAVVKSLCGPHRSRFESETTTSDNNTTYIIQRYKMILSDFVLGDIEILMMSNLKTSIRGTW